MKRILIIFGLLACLVLPAQIASAYSYDPGLLFSENIQALALEGNGSVRNYTKTPQSAGDPFDLIQIYSSSGVNALGGNNKTQEGFYFAEDILPETFRVSVSILGDTPLHSVIKDAYSVSIKNNVTYEYDGKSMTIYGGTKFLFVQTLDGDFVFAMTPAGIYNAVPVPAAVWLLGSGLAGVAALRRKLR